MNEVSLARAAEAIARLREREGKPNRPRYILGPQRYFSECDPASRASLVLPW